MADIDVRLAGREDAAAILGLIRELAAFENLSDEVKATEEDLLRDGFGENAHFECLLAERRGDPVGLALFFHNYSTFEGRRGVHLEDLYVREEARQLGVGRLLVQRLATLALQRGCARLELSVLHWNPARRFYDRLGFDHQDSWLPYRISGTALTALAEDG